MTGRRIRSILAAGLCALLLLGACSGGAVTRKAPAQAAAPAEKQAETAAESTAPQAAAETSKPAETTAEVPETEAAAKTKAAETAAAAEPETEAAEAESEEEAQNAGEGAEEASSGETEKTLAEKLCGRYIGQYGDETYLLDLTEFGGNLYAEGGVCAVQLTDISGAAELEPYSFWAMELIPTEADALQKTDADGAEIGIMTFSIMSNGGKYWGAPVPGSIRLTDEGIVFEGTDPDFGPPEKGTDSYALKRAGLVPDEAAAWAGALEGGSGSGKKSEAPEELYGLWKEAAETACFFEFLAPDENGNTALRVFQKRPGGEVMLGEGSYRADSTTVQAVFTLLGSGGMPQSFEREFSFTEEGLLKFAPDASDTEGETTAHLFERAEVSDVPLTVLYAPDDVSAYGEALTLETPAGKRPVTVQFAAAEPEEIENNGGNFVRLGNLVFFRTFTGEALGQADGLFGEFLNHHALQDGSEVLYYDRRTGKTGTAFTDSGNGPLYYLNGRFCSEKLIQPEGAEEGEPLMQVIEACWPDGSGREQLTTAAWSGIDGVSEDGRYLAVHEYEGGETFYATDGTMYRRFSREAGNGESCTYTGFAGNDLLYLLVTEEEGCRLCQYRMENGNEVVLGTAVSPEDRDAGYPEICQVQQDGERLTVSLCLRSGTAMMRSGYTVFEARSGVPDSLKVVWEGTPEGMDPEGSIWFWYNGADELQFTEHDPKGEAALDVVNYGNLILYDSPVSAIKLIPDYLTESPFHAEDGETSRILQTAEVVDGAVWLISAEGMRDREKDIGWRMGFDCRSMTWQRIPFEGVTAPADGPYPSETLLEQRAE